MKVLVTAGFGGIGLLAVKDLIKRGHEVAVFDISTSRNQRLKRRFGKKLNAFLGNIRIPEDVEAA